MRILIVDDSSADRDMIIEHIKVSEKEQKTIIDESCCLKDAFEKISFNNYDVIILDLRLPESEGVETIETMQKELEKIDKKIPIIVLTGNEDYSIGMKAWKMGVKDFICKEYCEKEDIKRALKFTYIKNKYLLKKS